MRCTCAVTVGYLGTAHVGRMCKPHRPEFGCRVNIDAETIEDGNGAFDFIKPNFWEFAKFGGRIN